MRFYINLPAQDLACSRFGQLSNIVLLCASTVLGTALVNIRHIVRVLREDTV